MTFANVTPAVPGFYSDPTWCRAGDELYLAHSSFEYFPGAPVFRATPGLAGFEQIGHVITRPEQADLSGGASTGIYGSTLRFHDGRFWFITTNILQVREGQLLFTADDPSGPWSDPVRVPVVGIDPDLAWDDDGTCYLTWCAFPGGISQVRIDPGSGALLEEPRRQWSGTGMKAPEGPHLYHVGERWYLLIAEGGTERGHCVSVARSDSPTGPWEPHPANPLLTHRSTAHPVQSVGHADLVEAPDGRWYACYHGTRPHGPTPEFHVLGRETMIAPVAWQDGWPRIVEEGYERTPALTSFVDDFRGARPPRPDGSALEPRWVTPSGTFAGVALTPAGLGLTASDRSRPVLTRLLDLTSESIAVLDCTRGDARLLVYLDDDHWYGVETRGGFVDAVARIGPVRQVLGSAPLADRARVELRLATALPAPTDGFPPPLSDTVTLAVGGTVLAELDGRYVSTEVAGGFTGRMVGVEVLSGTVTVASFSYTGADAEAGPRR